MKLTAAEYRDIFVDTGQLLKAAEFDKLANYAKSTGRPLDQLLMENSFITPEQFLQLLSDHFKVPATQLRLSDIDLSVIHALPESFAVEHLIIAFGRGDNVYQVALLNPADIELITDIEQHLGAGCTVYVTTELALRRSLVLYDGDLKQQVWRLVDKLEHTLDASERTEEESSAIKPLVENIIETAVLLEASDVHIEPYETEIIVRFRLDGLLQTIVSLPISFAAGVTATLKVEAHLKIDQKRTPQDGRFTAQIKGQEVNIRVSSIPSMWGEKIVLRILPKETHLFNVTNLGMLDTDLQLIKTQIQKPHGMILVTGPTNSGKSTTLYALLQQIGLERIDVVNISTIEDPIEYTMPRVTQMQVDPSVDLTFTNGLRALLRQDPDIIMVGEIRDSETADFAIQAALVGRLVLSSLHTNDAPATIPRLLNMGIEPYLIASTLSLIVAQRLARKLCVYCRESYVLDTETIEMLRRDHQLDRALDILRRDSVIAHTDPTELRFYRAIGCERCAGTGYVGRVGIFEILTISTRIQKVINTRSDSESIRREALDEGMKTMFEDGLAKIILGQLDIPELLRVVNA